MLIFLDETFRELDRGGEKHKFGAMCGVAIPIGDYTKIANTIYKLKLQHLGKDYADNSELKGKIFYLEPPSNNTRCTQKVQLTSNSLNPFSNS